MNPKSNSNQSSNNKKDPYLKFRYSRGLGDLIACILHSKLLGWLTKLITGKNKPCSICSQRANALNVLLPIPVWRLFFKDRETMVSALKLDLEESGYQVEFTDDKLGLSSFKANITESANSENNTTPPTIDYSDVSYMNNYMLVTSGENILGDFLIKTEIYKRK